MSEDEHFEGEVLRLIRHGGFAQDDYPHRIVTLVRER
jgi:hypothetical protein